MSIPVHTNYIYIYMEREREREIISLSLSIYIYIYNNNHNERYIVDCTVCCILGLELQICYTQMIICYIHTVYVTYRYKYNPKMLLYVIYRLF